MVNVLNFYMDDSGTRNPDHKIGRTPAHGNDWFSLGGILVEQDKEITIREKHEKFCKKWTTQEALHSSEIRSKSDNFRFIKHLSSGDQLQFHEELYQLMSQNSIIGMACVIDRPCYNDRYREKYGRKRWSLCKTAFAIAVERAAKYAHKNNFKLNIYPEKSDKKTDRIIENYFKEFKLKGMPFQGEDAKKYNAFGAKEFKETLYDIKFKKKTSPLVQIADLYLWPMSIGGYDKENRPYKRLMEDKKLIDCHLSTSDIPNLGIKYSCFDT